MRAGEPHLLSLARLPLVDARQRRHVGGNLHAPGASERDEEGGREEERRRRREEEKRRRERRERKREEEGWCAQLLVASSGRLRAQLGPISADTSASTDTRGPQLRNTVRCRATV